MQLVRPWFPEISKTWQLTNTRFVDLLVKSNFTWWFYGSVLSSLSFKGFLLIIWSYIGRWFRVFTCFVASYLVYNITISSSLKGLCSPSPGNAETTKIETTNYFVLRTILGYSKSVSYDFLLKMADIKSLEKRRQFQSLVMLYRCLYDKGAPYIREFFNFKDVQYNLRGLSTRLDLPPFNLEFMHRSFTFLASKLWNALPPKVRESQDIASFKRSLKAHMA